MVLPNGASDVDAAGVPLIISAGGNSTTSFSDLDTHDQATVMSAFKSKYMDDNGSVWRDHTKPLGRAVHGLPLGGSLLGLLHGIARSLLRQPGGVWADFASLFGALDAIPQGITEHTEAIANLNDITAVMNTTAAYVGDLQDMVTVPRSDLVTPAPRLTGGAVKTVDVLSGFGLGAALGVTIGALPVFTPKVTVASNTGTIYYTPVVVDRKGAVDKLRWIVGADTAVGSVDYYEMALCVYNPANSNIEKVYTSGNIKDGVANTNTLAEVAIPMGLNQQTTPGQILFVAHQQVAPGIFQNARTFAAKPQAGVGRPIDLKPLDACCFTAPNFTTGIPSSIPYASLTKENRFIPWSAVTVKAATL